MANAFSNERLEPLIFRVRGHRVVMDADLARLYGVDTKRFNQAFKRNKHRFPVDFAFRLTTTEVDNLRSQFATSSRQASDSLGHMWSQFVTTSQRSDRAVQMSVFVVRAFVRLREQVAANTAILKRLAEIDKTLLEHDSALRDVYQKLMPLLQPPADPPKRRIGFHTDED